MEFDRKPRMAASTRGAHAALMTLRIHAIPESFAEHVRHFRRDGHGNVDLTPQVVTEAHSAPCRVCLEDARVGEAVLLCTYSPFERPGPYATIGPIFVHAHRCTPFAPGAPMTDAIARRLLSLRAYDRGGRMVAADVIEGRELESLAQRLFEDPAASLLHVHHARAGCFACRIERGE